METRRPCRPDLDLVTTRLRTRSETIERALEDALRRAGLPRTAVAQIAAMAASQDPGRIEETRRRLEAEAVATGPSWEQLCRPSFASLSATHRPLRRA